MQQSVIELLAGEVVEVIYTDLTPQLVYGIKVKILDGQTPDPELPEISPSIITAVPLNFSYIRVPIIGEIVLLIGAPDSYSNGITDSRTMYYLDIVSLNFSIHNNALPTVSAKTVTTEVSGDDKKYNESAAGDTKQSKPPKVDNDFSENIAVKSLQPYVGDVIISGRYGNSIRFSTTPKSGKFKIPPNFSKAIGQPITIYRNTTQSKDTKEINDFITEDFTNEENVIVQASGQELKFEQASGVLTANKKYKINSWKDEKWGITPQTLISSGRIIFNSTQKEIIAFAKNGIGLSSETSITIDAKETISLNATKIELGTDSKEALILGNAFKTWIENLIQVLGTIAPMSPGGVCNALNLAPQWPGVESLKAQIETLLLSEVSFTKKKASASSEASSAIETRPAPTLKDFEMTPEEKEKVEKIQEFADDAITKAVDLNDDEIAGLHDAYNKTTDQLFNEENYDIS